MLMRWSAGRVDDLSRKPEGRSATRKGQAVSFHGDKPGITRDENEREREREIRAREMRPEIPRIQMDRVIRPRLVCFMDRPDVAFVSSCRAALWLLTAFLVPQTIHRLSVAGGTNEQSRPMRRDKQLLVVFSIDRSLDDLAGCKSG